MVNHIMPYLEVHFLIDYVYWWVPAWRQNWGGTGYVIGDGIPPTCCTFWLICPYSILITDHCPTVLGFWRCHSITIRAYHRPSASCLSRIGYVSALYISGILIRTTVVGWKKIQWKKCFTDSKTRFTCHMQTVLRPPSWVCRVKLQ